MTAVYDLSALDALKKIRAGELTSEKLVRSCLERIEERDKLVGAWAHLDPAKAIEDAIAADKAGNPGQLGGLPVGVKDIIDTSTMPTCYGSTIYGANQPVADAACVKLTKDNGGIVLGKTVTTEFAWRNPGKTANPHNPNHTPGGSSSGSAAGVADSQMPLAFGTQTAGSVIRPAAYCGIVGFKPTIDTHDKFGIKELSNYLDTLGTFARNVADVAFFDYLIRGAARPDLTIFEETPPIIGLMVPFRIEADDDILEAYEKAWRVAEKAGARLIDIPSTMDFERLADTQTVIMMGDAGTALSWEYDHYPERLTRFYRDSIATGKAISKSSLASAKKEADAARIFQAGVFEKVDVILTISAGDEAPRGLNFTGDPLFNRVWTLLGWPCLSLPIGVGRQGLPVGAQLVGPMGLDAKMLGAAAWLEKRVGYHQEYKR
ncbi:MAG: hypothetical protein CMM58_07480 [Rhodospirillaceae bacterium]|nr:hypothetical protein [Rhodospirillaceae bacterium]